MVIGVGLLLCEDGKLNNRERTTGRCDGGKLDLGRLLWKETSTTFTW